MCAVNLLIYKNKTLGQKFCSYFEYRFIYLCECSWGRAVCMSSCAVVGTILKNSSFAKHINKQKQKNEKTIRNDSVSQIFQVQAQYPAHNNIHWMVSWFRLDIKMKSNLSCFAFPADVRRSPTTIIHLMSKLETIKSLFMIDWQAWSGSVQKYFGTFFGHNWEKWGGEAVEPDMFEAVWSNKM